MVEELPFTYLHVFTYSARPGTPAAKMAGQVPPRVAHHRNRVLREIAGRKKRKFMASFVGRDLTAITLGAQGDGWTEALTDNYLKLRLAGRWDPNRWVNARIEAANEEELQGIARQTS